jgi:hypothetical protein
MTPETCEIQTRVDLLVSSSPPIDDAFRGFAFSLSHPQLPFKRTVDVVGALDEQTQRAVVWLVRAKTDWLNKNTQPLHLKTGAIEQFRALYPAVLEFKWGFHLNMEDFSSSSGIVWDTINKLRQQEEKKQKVPAGVWLPAPPSKLVELQRELRLIVGKCSKYQVAEVTDRQLLARIIHEPRQAVQPQPLSAAS